MNRTSGKPRHLTRALVNQDDLLIRRSRVRAPAGSYTYASSREYVREDVRELCFRDGHRFTRAG
jgi:hypothetical protein